MEKLVPGDIIRLNYSQEIFVIDKVFYGNYVDMTSTKRLKPELGLKWHPQFFSIKLEDFEIITHKFSKIKKCNT
jgi:hypothetical protein